MVITFNDLLKTFYCMVIIIYFIGMTILLIKLLVELIQLIYKDIRKGNKK